MRISVAAALAALSFVVGCGSDSSSGTGARPGTPARVDVVTPPTPSVVAGAPGGTFSVEVVDATGAPVSGVLVSFSATGSATVSPSSATTDASGVASTQVTTGTIAGVATVRASVTGVATPVASQIAVVAGPTTRVVVLPRSMRLLAVGDTSRIIASAQDMYGNLAATSTIAFSVADPTLVSVDAGGLVRVLRLGGTTLVVSSSGDKADTTVVTVLAAGATQCTGLAVAPVMTVGESRILTGVQYGCLSGATAGAEYSIVAFNGAKDSVNALPVSVTGNGVGTVPVTFSVAPTTGLSALRAAIGGPVASTPLLDESFHLKLLAQARARSRGSFSRARTLRAASASRSLSPSGAPVVSQSGLPPNTVVGDLVTLNVSADCGTAQNRGFRVAAIGAKSIVLADTLDPSAGFSDADYQRFAARFDTLVYPLDVGAFGAPSDIDGNGRVAILFTTAVNALTPANVNYFVGGFFYPGDLFPKTGVTLDDHCATSNVGEMFYMLAPDPTGKINGNKRTTGFVDSLTTGVLAHEFQHLINGSRRFYVNSAAESFEDVWLNEGLSHVAEELLYYRESGRAPRQNLGDAAVRAAPSSIQIFANDASANFFRLLEYFRAPGFYSPYAGDDQLATRGATWSFLRYTADRLGTTDGTIWQRFDDATSTGLNTLAAVYGTDPGPFFRDWAVANFLDDFGVPVDPHFTHPSWNYRDLFANTLLHSTVYPLHYTGLDDNVKTDFLVRGLSASYMRVSVPANREGLVTFSSGGGLPNGAFQFVVVRTK
jgi:hypothetical protein